MIQDKHHPQILPLIYVTGLTSSSIHGGRSNFMSVAHNTQRAKRLGQLVIVLGGIPIISPILFGSYEDQTKPLKDPWVGARLSVLRGCSAMVTTSGWENSDMVHTELQTCVEAGLPFFHGIVDLECPSAVFMKNWIADWMRLHGRE